MKIKRVETDRPRTAAITADNYVELAKEFIRLNDGVGVVICNAEGAARTGNLETPEQWRAWLAFFDQIGFATVFARKHGLMTVPTPWPWQFSPSASADIPPAPIARRSSGFRTMNWAPLCAMPRKGNLMPILPPGGPYRYVHGGVEHIPTGAVYPWRQREAPDPGG